MLITWVVGVREERDHLGADNWSVPASFVAADLAIDVGAVTANTTDVVRGAGARSASPPKNCRGEPARATRQVDVVSIDASRKAGRRR
jgi:hypothetical protein